MDSGTSDLLFEARGQTALAAPILDALQWRPELLVIVSDGFENDPAGASAEILRVYKTRLDSANRTEIVHANPVFDAQHFSPRPLCPEVTTVGLRDAGLKPMPERSAALQRLALTGLELAPA